VLFFGLLFAIFRSFFPLPPSPHWKFFCDALVRHSSLFCRNNNGVLDELRLDITDLSQLDGSESSYYEMSQYF